MMPQLGVLADVHPEAATEVFEKDCLIWLGTCVAPRGTAKPGKPAFTIELEREGRKEKYEIPFGELKLVPMEVGETMRARIDPAKGFDMGEGPGKPVERQVHGGVVGLVLDGRGRPIALDPADPMRVEKIRSWANALDAYPEDVPVHA